MSELGKVIIEIAERNKQRDTIKPKMKRSRQLNETIIYLCAKFKEQGFLTTSTGMKELAYNILNMTLQGTRDILGKIERCGLIEKRKIGGKINEEAYFPTKNNGHMIITDYLEDALINQSIEFRIKEKILDDMKREK